MGDPVTVTRRGCSPSLCRLRHAEFTRFATKLNIPHLKIIPISPLQGDNVVNRSENMSWYSGPTLRHHLEQGHVASDRVLETKMLVLNEIDRIPNSN